MNTIETMVFNEIECGDSFEYYRHETILNDYTTLGSAIDSANMEQLKALFEANTYPSYILSEYLFRSINKGDDISELIAGKVGGDFTLVLIEYCYLTRECQYNITRKIVDLASKHNGWVSYVYIADLVKILSRENDVDIADLLEYFLSNSDFSRGEYGVLYEMANARYHGKTLAVISSYVVNKEKL